MKTITHTTQDHITIMEAAEILGIKEQSVRDLISRGKKLTPYKYFHMTLLSRDEILEYKKKRRD